MNNFSMLYVSCGILFLFLIIKFFPVKTVDSMGGTILLCVFFWPLILFTFLIGCIAEGPRIVINRIRGYKQ